MRKYFKSDIIRLAKPVSQHIVYFLLQDNEIIHIGYNNSINIKSDLIFNKQLILKFKTYQSAQSALNQYISKFIDKNQAQHCIPIPYNKTISIQNLHYSKLNNNYIFKVNNKTYIAPIGHKTYLIDNTVFTEPKSFLGPLQALN